MSDSTQPTTATTRQLRKRRRVNYAQLDDDGNPKHTADYTMPNPPVKPKPRVRVTGRLSGLLDMPLDILFEIFGHLTPYDLLRLSRASKEFRRVLLSRSTISIWKSSRQNVPGMPDCPPDMSEPRFASLAFDPHCYYCGANGVRNPEWPFRIRICGKCAKTRMDEVWSYRFEGGPPDPDANPEPYDLVPWKQGKKPSTKAFIKEEYEDILQRYRSLPTEKEKAAYLKERRAFVEGRVKWAASCKSWSSQQSNDRSNELQQIKDERRKAITEKLRALGYGPDIDSIRWPDSLAEHKLVKQPHRLTERIWKNIQPEIAKYMEEMRRKRLLREFAALVSKRKEYAIPLLRAFKNRQLPQREPMPEPPDFCSWNEVSGILNSPVEIDVTIATFNGLEDKLPEWVEEWRRGVIEHLIHAMDAPPTAPRRLAFDWYEDADADDFYQNDGLASAMDHFFGLGRVLGRGDASGSGSATKIKEEENEQDKGKGKGKEKGKGKGKGKEKEKDKRAINPAALAKLGLATTIFNCNKCSPSMPDWHSYDMTFGFQPPGEILTYPHVAAHRCLTRRPSSFCYPFGLHGRGADIDASMRLEHQTSARTPWKSTVYLNVKVQKYAEQVIKMVGLDPKKATTEDMDQLKVLFVCTHDWCLSSTRKVGDKYDLTLMTWRKAIQHYTLHVWDNDTFKMVTPEMMIQGVLVAHSTTKELAVFDCVHCRDTTQERLPMKVEDVKQHVREKHKTTRNPIINVDYARNFAMPNTFFHDAIDLRISIHAKQVPPRDMKLGSRSWLMRRNLMRAGFGDLSAHESTPKPKPDNGDRGEGPSKGNSKISAVKKSKGKGKAVVKPDEDSETPADVAQIVPNYDLDYVTEYVQIVEPTDPNREHYQIWSKDKSLRQVVNEAGALARREDRVVIMIGSEAVKQNGIEWKDESKQAPPPAPDMNDSEDSYEYYDSYSFMDDDDDGFGGLGMGFDDDDDVVYGGGAGSNGNGGYGYLLHEQARLRKELRQLAGLSRTMSALQAGTTKNQLNALDQEPAQAGPSGSGSGSGLLPIENTEEADAVMEEGGSSEDIERVDVEEVGAIGAATAADDERIESVIPAC